MHTYINFIISEHGVGQFCLPVGRDNRDSTVENGDRREKVIDLGTRDLADQIFPKVRRRKRDRGSLRLSTAEFREFRDR